MRHKRCLTAAFQRTRMKPGKSAQTWLAAVRIPQLDPLRVKLGTKAIFFWTVAAFSKRAYGMFVA